MDASGRIALPTREPTDNSTDTSAVEQLRRILASYADSQVEGIGIGIPGIADSKRGTVWAPNIRGWDHVPLASELSQRLGQILVVESDRNTSVLAEVAAGACKGCSDAVFLILGTGIGAGIWSGGRLLRGSADIGGAVGWIPVTLQGRAYHFEEVAAGPGIERLAGEAGLPPDVPKLAEMAAVGDPAAKSLFEEVGQVVGQGLSVLVSLLDPEVIAIGGGVGNVWPYLRESAETAMKRWAQPISVGHVRVLVSGLGDSAGIIGAAASARLAVEGGVIR